MKHCGQCGATASLVANFCESCGARLQRSESTISVSSVRVSATQSTSERNVHCDFAGGNITIVDESPDGEVRIICPHARRFDGFGWYRIDCEVQGTFFGSQKCGIFEGMRKFK